MSVSIPGGRSVAATLDEANPAENVRTSGSSTGTRSNTCVVACPPHPQHGGHRGDARLEAVSDALTARGIDCLRIDYGPWDDGYGEREDVRNAIRWAADRYDRVGCFGFSFGGATALLATATVDREVAAVATLAPAPRLAPNLDAIDAVASIDCPIQVIYGERDDTVDSTELAAAVADRNPDNDVQSFAADHFFIGQQEKVGTLAAEFLTPVLRPDR